MHSFFIRCAIFLLLVLTENLTVAFVKNDSVQWMTPAKIFTNYLKVPWIDLNSSWKDKVASSCRDDIITLFESADAGEMWALQMLDAASKIPAGIFTGNIRDLGMYAECVRVKGHQNPANIQGRHCMVSLSMPPKFVRGAAAALYIQKLSIYNPTPNVGLNFAASLCLPSSCGVEDIAGFVNASIQGTTELAELEIEVAKVTCSDVEATSDNLSLGTILTISFFAMVIILLVFCTVCEYVVEVRPDKSSLALKTLAKFSLHANAIKLLSTKASDDSFPAIHGIKFFSICLVVMMHRLLSTLVKPLVNLSFMYEVRESWLAPFVILTPLSVDTFFLISGFLSTYWILNKSKLNIPELLVHRYLRLTPCIAVLLLIVIFVVPHLGSGPLWQIGLEMSTDFCRSNWWTNLFYIQNFVNREEMCLPHTWYTAVEMQLFWASLFLLYPLYYRLKFGLVISSLFLIASLIVPAIHLLVNEYSALTNFNKITAIQYKEAVNFYSMTYNRGLPYFMGVLLAYYLVNYKRELTKVQVALNWILVCLFVIFCVWTTPYLQPVSIAYNPIWEAAFVSLGRLGWSLTVAWIVYACIRGYGGPVTRILSLPIFAPISRLSYGIYLVSAILQFAGNTVDQSAEFYSNSKTIYLALSDLVISIVAAFVMNLCFESPVVVLEKIFRTKKPSGVIKRPAMRKNEKHVAIIGKYPDSANGRTSSDSAIHARMSQPDFWRTVSDVLKTLGKNSTKTPGEWVKTWQDWKSDQSKNDSKWKTCPNEVQNGSAKLETGITAMEKELLIFLTAVHWGLDDTVSSEGANIAEPTRSHSDSCSSPNEVSVRKLVDSASMENAYLNKNVDRVPCKCNTAM